MSYCVFFSNVSDHFNCILPCVDAKTNDHLKMTIRVKCVLMFMFPLQHKLPSILAEPSKSAAFQSGSASDDKFNFYKNGVLETDFTKNRVPKRLSGKLFDLIKTLIKSNSKCSYTALLNRFCPNKHEKASAMINDQLLSQVSDDCGNETTILMKRYDEPLNTDAGNDTSYLLATPKHLDSSFAASQWEEMKKVDLSSSLEEIFQFCKSVFQHVIPRELVGSERNWKCLMDCVAKYIRLRRYEDLRLSHIAENMTIPEIWSEGGGHGQAHFYKCRELHLEFLYWVFTHFLIPLLRAHFYATEISGGANKIVYYRHDVWCALTEPAFDEFCTTSLVPLPRKKARELVVNSKIGIPSAFRLIPKPGGGYRGIACLGRAREKTVYNPWTDKARVVPVPSVNKVLKDVFLALSFEHWKTGKSSTGAAISSFQDLHNRLLEFKCSLPQELPKLYFVKVDVKKCYDTIPAEVAFKLADTLLKNGYRDDFKSYFLHKFQVVQCKAGKEKHVRSKFMSIPEYAASDESAISIARRQAAKSAMPPSMITKNANTRVYIDLASGNVCPGEELSNLLKEHLTQNLIRVGKTVYKQDVGIPQGSVLSTLLCNIVYSYLEREIFSDEKAPLAPHLLVRFVDDFLFISPSRSLAERWLTRMAQGFPEYGAQIHKEKTVTNFKPRKFHYENNQREPNFRNVTTLLDQASTTSTSCSRVIMPYIGLGINTQTLEIVKLPASTATAGAADSLSIRAHGAPNSLATFKSNIFGFIKMRLSATLVSLQLNSWPTVLKNIEAVASDTGYRIVLATLLWLSKNARFSSSVVIETIGQSMSLFVERTRSPNYKSFVHCWEADIVNTTARAMLKVFKTSKRHKFDACIAYLETLIR